MIQRSKQFISPSPNRRPGAKRQGTHSERGIAFLILMMVLTMLLISLTVSLPDIYTQGQREREEELIFRGGQYARAIMLYHRQFNRFPAKVDDLVKKTNGFRFLRHPFPDPMTRSGKWRLIHANAAGVVIDSKTLTPPKTKKPGESGSSSESQNTGQTNASGEANASDETNASGQANAQPGQPQQAAGSSDNEVKGAFIVGVASTSTHKSIRVWNNKERYDLWEFLGVATATVPSGQASSPSGPSTGNPQGNPAGGTQMGNTNPMNPQR
jgi:type II secretory pathway pseudopilin PulG